MRLFGAVVSDVSIRDRCTYANVMSTMAVFIALGGTSYAAVTITGRSVQDSSLTGADVKNSSLTGSDVKNRSVTAADLAAPEAPHLVGAGGEPPFVVGWSPPTGYVKPFSSPRFFKDQLGFVHLEGAVAGGTASDTSAGNIFVLPTGYRPGATVQFTGGDASGTGQIAVLATGEVRALSGAGNTLLTFEGLTFRPGS